MTESLQLTLREVLFGAALAAGATANAARVAVLSATPCRVRRQGRRLLLFCRHLRAQVPWAGTVVTDGRLALVAPRGVESRAAAWSAPPRRPTSPELRAAAAALVVLADERDTPRRRRVGVGGSWPDKRRRRAA